MNTTLKLSRPTKSLGRNGIINTTGVDIIMFERDIVLTPITSKGMLARCDISIPKEDIVAFVMKLLHTHNQNMKPSESPLNVRIGI